MERNTNLKKREREKKEENTIGMKLMEGGLIRKQVEGLGRSV